MSATTFLSLTAWLYWTPLSLISLMLITGCSVLVNGLLFFCLSWIRSERSPFPVKPMEVLFAACAILVFVVFVLSFHFPIQLIGTAFMVRYASASLLVAVAMSMITTENVVPKIGYASFKVTNTKLFSNWVVSRFRIPASEWSRGFLYEEFLVELRNLTDY